MNQARKFNFKTHVEKLNPTSRTDLSNKTLHSILYWKILFKPFPYKSFGWCNAHSVQADALWGRSFKFQMKTHHKINTSLLMLREWTYTASSRDALGNTSLLSAVKGYIIIIFTIKYCLSCLQLFTSLHHCHHHKHPHQRHHHRLIPTYCFILIIIIRMINWSSSFNHIIIPVEQARPDDWSVWYLWMVQKISNSPQTQFHTSSK